MPNMTKPAIDEGLMVKFLDQRYGDGSVYFRKPNDRALYTLAISLGLISEQGYVTAAGKHFWAARI